MFGVFGVFGGCGKLRKWLHGSPWCFTVSAVLEQFLDAFGAKVTLMTFEADDLTLDEGYLAFFCFAVFQRPF